jgi:sugar phosphate isomerase/epimerase
LIPAFQTFHFSPTLGGTVPITDVLRNSRAVGFRAVGLDVTSIDAHLARGGTLNELTDLREELGLVFTDLIHLAITGDDGPAIERVAALCSALSIPWCLAAVPKPLAPDAMVAGLREAADALAGSGARLAIEFCSHLHLATLADAVTLAAEVGWDRAGLVLDALHFARTGSDWETLAALGAEHIAYLQVSDAPAVPTEPLAVESRFHRALPGYGGLDVVGWLRAVAATGFDGFACAEVLSERWLSTRPEIAASAIHIALVDVLERAA